ncbi:MAG: formylglycine-generating enzyme family protein [Acaryochloridaceae cyanobacterium RL_2_7]|nr:formylglycine-generating enzyme family protein [Acaryochloridaceae cyanobacterium RL_2_7]
MNAKIKKLISFSLMPLTPSDLEQMPRLQIRTPRPVPLSEVNHFLANLAYAYNCLYSLREIGRQRDALPKNSAINLAGTLGLPPSRDAAQSLVPFAQQLTMMPNLDGESVLGSFAGEQGLLQLICLYLNHPDPPLATHGSFKTLEDSQAFLTLAKQESKYLADCLSQLHEIGVSSEPMQILLEQFVFLPLRQLKSSQEWIQGAELSTSGLLDTIAESKATKSTDEFLSQSSESMSVSVLSLPSLENNVIQYKIERLPGGVELAFACIPRGNFLMGSPDTDEFSEGYERPQHLVTIPQFYMGRTPVTQAQWHAVMGNNPSEFQGGDRPVEQVSWDEAIDFCQKLSNLIGRECRLPSEAEWEYACRAGTTTPFYFGDKITRELGNLVESEISEAGIDQAPRNQTTDVGLFPANAFGLYDMHGNIWEWCLDHYHPTYDGAPNTNAAWVTDMTSNTRILRGGSWLSSPWHCRSAYRFSSKTRLRNSMVGFRVCSE